MGDRWEPPGYGPPGGGPWGPPAGDRWDRPGGDAGPGGHTPGDGDTGGYTPGGYTPGGYAPGGGSPGYAPGGHTPGGGSPGYAPGDPGPGGWTAAGGGWGSATFGAPGPDHEDLGDAQQIGRPPFVWLVVALVLGLVGAAVAWTLGASVWAAGAAWVLAGPVAIGLLAVFTRLDVPQRARSIYDAPSWIPALYWSTIAAAALGIGLSAWSIAEWAGRQ